MQLWAGYSRPWGRNEEYRRLGGGLCVCVCVGGGASDTKEIFVIYRLSTVSSNFDSYKSISITSSLTIILILRRWKECSNIDQQQSNCKITVYMSRMNGFHHGSYYLVVKIVGAPSMRWHLCSYLSHLAARPGSAATWMVICER